MISWKLVRNRIENKRIQRQKERTRFFMYLQIFPVLRNQLNQYDPLAQAFLQGGSKPRLRTTRVCFSCGSKLSWENALKCTIDTRERSKRPHEWRKPAGGRCSRASRFIYPFSFIPLLKILFLLPFLLLAIACLCLLFPLVNVEDISALICSVSWNSATCHHFRERRLTKRRFALD